jgi:hypothetical protein
MTPRAAVVLLAVLTASCGVPLMKLPKGPGAPISAEEAFASLAEATAFCRGLHTLTAEVAVTGSAGGRRVRGRLLAGVADAPSARLEAVAPFGPPLFIFAATVGDATLLLPRDRRVLAHAPPQEVLDAVAGVPLDETDLFTTLTGCPQAYSFTTGFAVGADWRVVRASGGARWKTLYLRRGGAVQAWRLVAVLRDSASWRAEYPAHDTDIPRSIHLTSADARSSGAPGFNVTLTLSQVETNVPLGADVFTIQIPKDAEPITLEELRRSGPLAPRSDGK